MAQSITFFCFAAKEKCPNSYEDVLAEGYHKRASIIHFVNVSTWTALVRGEVRSGQKAPRLGREEKHCYREKRKFSTSMQVK